MRGVYAVWTPDHHLRDLIERSARSAWMSTIEPKRLAAGGGDGGASGHLPRQIRTALDGRGLEQRTIGTYGWRVGQGLRTGGNRFFYGECLREMGNEALLSVDSAISSEPVLVPKDVLRPVVRKQQDLVVAQGDPCRSAADFLISLGSFWRRMPLRSSSLSGTARTRRCLSHWRNTFVGRQSLMSVLPTNHDSFRIYPPLPPMCVVVAAEGRVNRLDFGIRFQRWHPAMCRTSLSRVSTTVTHRR